VIRVYVTNENVADKYIIAGRILSDKFD